MEIEITHQWKGSLRNRNLGDSLQQDSLHSWVIPAHSIPDQNFTKVLILHQLLYHLSPFRDDCQCLWRALSVRTLKQMPLAQCFLHAQYAQRAKYQSAVILLVVKWYISVGCSVLLKFQYGFVLSKHKSTLPSQDCLAVCVVWGVPW